MREGRTTAEAGLLAVARFRVPEAQGRDFAERAGVALDALSSRPGCLRGRLCRSVDDPELWTLLTEWVGVGTYRRALSAYEVKVSAVPLLSLAIDEPGAYEVLLPGATTESASGSGRAADADRSGPGRSAAPQVPTSLESQ